jgi:hypothetical protein
MDFATDLVSARKHHADIAGRNPRRPGGVKFLTLGKRCALVKGAIRSAHAGAEQRRCFDYEDAVQSTVPIVVGEQPKGHAGFIARDDGLPILRRWARSKKADPFFDLPDQEPKRAPSNKTMRSTSKR